MGDTEGVSKKRAAGREISKDNPGLDDDDEVSEQELGTFKKASDEVIATRRIVKVRRNQSSSAAPSPSPNPFANIKLVPPPVPAPLATVKSVVQTEEKTLGGQDINVKSGENSNQSESNIEESAADKEKNGKAQTLENDAVEVEKIEKDSEKSEDAASKDGEADKTEKGEDTKQEDVETDIKNTKQEDVEAGKVDNEPEAKKSEDEEKIKDDGSNLDSSGDATPFSSFQQLSSNQNAFTGFAGTGFSSTAFSFGSIDKGGSSAAGSGSGSGSLFGALTKNGGSSLFAVPEASSTASSDRSGVPSMQEVSVETGEENEKPVFVADSVLFEYLDGSWKERGKGEIKVNVPVTETVRARLVMRTRGNYRLILNARLFPDMKLTNMEKKGITFACVNSLGDGKDGLSTFALKFKDPSIVDEFKARVMEHKSKTPVATKTPENSPKASSDE